METTKGELPLDQLEKKIVRHPRAATLGSNAVQALSIWTEYYHEGELVRRDISHRPMTEEEVIEFSQPMKGIDVP